MGLPCEPPQGLEGTGGPDDHLAPLEPKLGPQADEPAEPGPVTIGQELDPKQQRWLVSAFPTVLLSWPGKTVMSHGPFQP